MRMNASRATKPTLFLSDLHLSPARPALVASFLAFCAGPARDAAGVYVLGDLFDTWIGDDQLREPLAMEVVVAITGVTSAGVPVGVISGNRDFLLGERFARASGATLLPERIVVNVGATPTLILHGDELCTGDVAYQRLRAVTHDPKWQRRALALPYPVRRGIANWLRGRSRKATAAKPEAIMDVESRAVDAAFRIANVTRMVHGHTHRPAHHHLVVDGRDCERFVLADWYDHGSYLAFDAAGARIHDVPPAPE
jgi:UDP-2,3-diacylglucosamine hydrolase